MSLVERVYEIAHDRMRELAQTIEGELKAEAYAHARTGRAAGSISIYEEGENSIFVGAYIGSDYNDGGLHLYYLDQGNGGNRKVIRSSRPTDRLGREPGKLKIMNGMHMQYADKVHGYKGFHIVREVANRHR